MNKNLKPYKKGESGNLSGRPKGSLNRSTIIQKWLLAEQSVNHPLTDEKVKLNQIDLIILSMIKEARSGNISAFKALMEMAFDKQDSTTEEKRTLTPTQKRYEAMSTEQLNEELKRIRERTEKSKQRNQS